MVASKKRSKRSIAKAGVIQALPKSEWECPSCGSSDFNILSSLPETRHAGILHGKKFTSVTRQRVQCGVCSRVAIQTDHKFVPSLWKE